MVLIINDWLSMSVSFSSLCVCSTVGKDTGCSFVTDCLLNDESGSWLLTAAQRKRRDSCQAAASHTQAFLSSFHHQSVICVLIVGTLSNDRIQAIFEPVMLPDNFHVHWKFVSVSLLRLNITLYADDLVIFLSSSHDFIGEFSTSYRELSRGQSQFNVYEVRCVCSLGLLQK